MRKLFPGLQDNETIYLVVRQHWMVLLMHVLVWLIFVVALLAFNRYAPQVIPSLFQDLPGKIVELFTQIYALFLIASLFIIWILYYLNTYVITADRIVDINQVGLFNHTISELNLEKIEDVTSEVHGILGHIFDYGTVYVQTAGTIDRFQFDNIPNPGKITKIILGLYENRTSGKPNAAESV